MIRIVLALTVALLLPAGADAAPRFHLDVETELPALQPLDHATPSVDLSLQASQDGELTVEERKAIQERLKKRRTLLEIHQVLSFVAAGSIIAADVVGMFNHVALEDGDPVRSELEGSLALHRALVAVSIGSYFGAGITAWTAPPAYTNAQIAAGKKKADSGDVHVALSVAHGICMGTMIATGFAMANVAKGEDWDHLLSAHTVTGFATAGLVIAAGIAIGSF